MTGRGEELLAVALAQRVVEQWSRELGHEIRWRDLSREHQTAWLRAITTIRGARCSCT